MHGLLANLWRPSGGNTRAGAEAVSTRWLDWSERARLALAAVSGLLWAAAFPKWNFAGLGWVAPGLLLLAARGSVAPFRIGYVGGLAYGLASFYWLVLIPVRFYPILGWVALCGYLACYPAVWCWLSVRLDPGMGASKGEGSWAWRMSFSLACGATWVGLEMLQARLLTGFPWDLLGVSQYRQLPLIQLAAITGVYGISFVMVWVSVSLMLALTRLVRRPTTRLAWLADLVLPVAAVTVCCLAGLARMASMSAVSRELRVTLVQPSIPQTMIWNADDNLTRFRRLLDLSEVAMATKPDLLVWPEAATPGLIRFEQDIYRAVTNLVRAHQVWLVLGADDAEPRGADEADYFNSSFLFNPQGNVAASYRKRRLVIFGEYIPLAHWLPFMKWLTPIGGGFVSGTRAVPFELPDLHVRTATLICFEDVFPHFVRDYATEETDFLLNLTNDGWFGESAAQWQQAANAVFRAVENGLPLVRCANNGLTCWIDAAGGMHEVYFGDSTDIYGAGFKTARIPLRPGGRPATRPCYNQYGDWFGWSCLGVATLLHGTSGLKLRRQRRNVEP
jgi:apolipoprotein N-acyltransferase